MKSILCDSLKNMIIELFLKKLFEHSLRFLLLSIRNHFIDHSKPYYCPFEAILLTIPSHTIIHTIVHSKPHYYSYYCPFKATLLFILLSIEDNNKKLIMICYCHDQNILENFRIFSSQILIYFIQVKLGYDIVTSYCDGADGTVEGVSENTTET